MQLKAALRIYLNIHSCWRI